MHHFDFTTSAAYLIFVIFLHRTLWNRWIRLIFTSAQLNSWWTSFSQQQVNAYGIGEQWRKSKQNQIHVSHNNSPPACERLWRKAGKSQSKANTYWRNLYYNNSPPEPHVNAYGEVNQLGGVFVNGRPLPNQIRWEYSTKKTIKYLQCRLIKSNNKRLRLKGKFW